MSFNYSYTKNILEPAWRRLEHATSRGYERSYERAKAGGSSGFGAKARGFAGGVGGFARSFGPGLAIFGAAILANMLTSVPRQYIFDKDNWDKHVKTGDLGTWLMGLAVSRSGVAGTFDPLTQVYDNLRYQSDLSSLFEGATPAYLLRNIKDLIMPWAGQAESPNANTQYNNQARAFYNLILQPLEVAGLTMMNSVGGPVTQGVTSAMMQYLTSPQVANSFADFLTGPKGSTTGEAAGEGDETGGGEAEAGIPALEGEMPDGQPSQPSGAQPGNLGSSALGFADDIAAPLFKALEKPWSVLPGPAKLGAAGVMAALYGIHWWNETAPWRDHPDTSAKP
jgi:hypothetical protein